MKKVLAFLILSAACFAQTVVTGAGGSTQTALNGWLGGFYTGTSPAANTTYYYGSGPANTAPQTTTASTWPVVAPLACKLKAVAYHLYIAGTKDTAAENITLSLYDVTTSTNLTDSNQTFAMNGSTWQNVSVTSTTDSIAAGDNLLLRMQTPVSWTTQPTLVMVKAELFCY